jgi:hypothetical protein
MRGREKVNVHVAVGLLKEQAIGSCKIPKQNGVVAKIIIRRFEGLEDLIEGIASQKLQGIQDPFVGRVQPIVVLFNQRFQPRNRLLGLGKFRSDFLMLSIQSLDPLGAKIVFAGMSMFLKQYTFMRSLLPSMMTGVAWGRRRSNRAAVKTLSLLKMEGHGLNVCNRSRSGGHK